MEPPTCGSLMATSVRMTAIGLLPPYLFNMFIYLLLRGTFTPHPFVCCYYFPTLRKCMVMYSTKGTCFSIPWFTFIFNNMIIIKMDIRMSRVVILFFAVSSVSMAMRACLSSFLAMDTTMGWWGCVPIISFPWRFRWCLRRIWHHRAFSLGLSQAWKLRSLHNLQWLIYALVINTKFFFLFVPRPSKEPHVCPSNWDLQISNRN